MKRMLLPILVAGFVCAVCYGEETEIQKWLKSRQKIKYIPAPDRVETFKDENSNSLKAKYLQYASSNAEDEAKNEEKINQPKEKNDQTTVKYSAGYISPLLRPIILIEESPREASVPSRTPDPLEYNFSFDRKPRQQTESSPYSYGYQQPDYSSSYSSGTLRIKPNAYGLGVNSDQYGRPVRYEVIENPQANTDLLRVKQNAYGPGVGSDQYGRPIGIKPAY